MSRFAFVFNSLSSDLPCTEGCCTKGALQELGCQWEEAGTSRLSWPNHHPDYCWVFHSWLLDSWNDEISFTGLVCLSSPPPRIAGTVSIWKQIPTWVIVGLWENFEKAISKTCGFKIIQTALLVMGNCKITRLQALGTKKCWCSNIFRTQLINQIRHTIKTEFQKYVLFEFFSRMKLLIKIWWMAWLTI